MHADTDSTETTGVASILVSLLSHLLVAVISAVAGVILGGYLAFQTGYWEGFKAWIEGLGGTATALVWGLFFVAVVVALAASVRAANA